MRILILKMGTTEPSVVVRYGDYDQWFRDVFESLGCEVEVLPVFQGGVLPEPLEADGLVLTGSPLSVRQEEPWMRQVGDWTLRWGLAFPRLGTLDRAPSGRSVAPRFCSRSGRVPYRG